MRLVYRGNRYEQETIPMEMAGSSVIGSYRGSRYELAYPRHIPVPQPVQDLQYRGVSYHRTENGTVLAGDPVRQARSQQPPASLRKKQQQNQLDQVHRLYLMRRLEHRLEVAQARGDENLVHQLEKEMQQIA